MKSSENAETRSTRIGPEPGKMLPDTFQAPLVRPAIDTGGFAKVITFSLYVKSPWKPTYGKAPVICVTVTGWETTVVVGTEVSMLAIGRATVSGAGPAKVIPPRTREKALIARITALRVM